MSRAGKQTSGGTRYTIEDLEQPSPLPTRLDPGADERCAVLLARPGSGFPLPPQAMQDLTVGPVLFPGAAEDTEDKPTICGHDPTSLPRPRYPVAARGCIGPSSDLPQVSA